MKYDSFEFEKKAAFTVAELMVLAAKTAPKGCGLDNIETIVVDGDEKSALTREMRKIAKESGADFFARDADNTDESHLVVLIGAKDNPVELDCGLCGFGDCEKLVKAGGRCTFNITDLGIAVGSAVSLAADHRADNRVLFSAGLAAVRLGLFPETIKTCYGIPLASSAKNIFFDRGDGDDE